MAVASSLCDAALTDAPRFADGYSNVLSMIYGCIVIRIQFASYEDGKTVKRRVKM